MGKRLLLLVGTLIVILSVGAVYFYSASRTEEAGEEKLGVVVTIPPQAEFVEEIGGDKVEVTVMVPPGASPHTYEPKASQLRKVGKAEMYAKVGSGVEFELTWTDKIIDTNKDMLVVDCSKGVTLIEAGNQHEENHEHNGADPHIWLSPKNVKIMVENIYKGLAQIDTANKEYYQKNKEAYLQKLDKLDKEITQTLRTEENRQLLVYHPAWAYFTKDYNLEQIPIEKEGKEPTPQGIANLIKQAKDNNITIIFASPEFSTKSAEVIANEIGGEVVLLSPLEKNYLENMRKVAVAFAKI